MTSPLRQLARVPRLDFCLRCGSPMEVGMPCSCSPRVLPMARKRGGRFRRALRFAGRNWEFVTAWALWAGLVVAALVRAR